MEYKTILMPNRPKLLSVVTLSFNQGEFLRDCITSILGQISDCVEYIIVDPGSSDRSREIIESYGSQIKKVFKSDSGPAEGLNNGFNLASGQFYAFLNADDLLLPGAINTILNAIKADQNVDVFCFGGYMTDKYLRKLRPMRSFRFTAERYCRGNTSIFQPGLVFSASIFHKIGGFNTTNNTCWDAELAVEMSLSGATFVDRPDKVAYFRLHEQSITGLAQNLHQNETNKRRLYKRTFCRNPGAMSNCVYQLARLEKYLYPTYTLEMALYTLRRMLYINR